tara:strand:- start:365 stop:643 length:279 start_codon:yes stop_codon:yes gene_type:complete
MDRFEQARKEEEALRKKIEKAIWEGDEETLHALAPCECCCGEHTYLRCPARLYQACRSGLNYEETTPNEDSWLKHYTQHHGMTVEQFYGEEE